jgi:hypothetical protein
VSDGSEACDSGSSCTDDGELQLCDEGTIRTSACGSRGFSCTDGRCEGDGAACEGGFAEDDAFEPTGTSCDGATLLGCLAGKQARLDCTKQGPGFSCHTSGDVAFCGLADECIPDDNYGKEGATPTSCDGSVLTFCNAGRLEQLDCRDLGFEGCEIDTAIGHYGCTPVLLEE